MGIKYKNKNKNTHVKILNFKTWKESERNIKMGRKIPGKKHHGVKDPEKQKKKREAPMKLKANARPKNLDDQEIPKKLMIISKLREDAKKPNVPKPKVPKSNLLDSTKHMGLEMKLPGMKKNMKQSSMLIVLKMKILAKQNLSIVKKMNWMT